MSKSYTELMDDASKTAHTYLVRAVKSVDEVLGEGASLKYPEIVAGVVQAASNDYLASILANDVSRQLGALSDAVYGIKDRLE